MALSVPSQIRKPFKVTAVHLGNGKVIKKHDCFLQAFWTDLLFH